MNVTKNNAFQIRAHTSFFSEKDHFDLYSLLYVQDYCAENYLQAFYPVYKWMIPWNFIVDIRIVMFDRKENMDSSISIEGVLLIHSS